MLNVCACGWICAHRFVCVKPATATLYLVRVPWAAAAKTGSNERTVSLQGRPVMHTMFIKHGTVPFI